MIKAPVDLQDLRRKLYLKAKADFGWRRWNRDWLYDELGLFNDYYVSYKPRVPKVAPA